MVDKDKHHQIGDLFAENSSKSNLEHKDIKEDQKYKISMPKSLIKQIIKDSVRKLLIVHIPKKHE